MRRILFKSENILLSVFLVFSLSCTAQKQDWRNKQSGSLIFSNGYIDQPYVVVLGNGNWFCVFTTGADQEGAGGQHIVFSISKDQGKSWSEPEDIEPATGPAASWAMPYLNDFGRIYVFYDYNGDMIEELNGEMIRNDMLGWYCYRFTDDYGETWSERYRLPVRTTEVDLRNDWHGEVQILWGIGKPVHVDDGMMFGFSKIGKYMLDDIEGWFFRCDNINLERDPEKLVWEMLPEGDKGLRSLKLGPIQSEQNLFQLNSGDLYSMYRTISGHPASSYSRDGGKTWTTPEIPQYYTGKKIKHPRACARIWKCRNGKYLFWHHNHGGWNVQGRNPAWISGGIERSGEVIWSQPEILFYEDDIQKRMSYPDLIEQGGKYWITETNKEEAHCHEIDLELLKMVWQQFDLSKIVTKGLVLDLDEKDMEPGSIIEIPKADVHHMAGGFTLDMVLNLEDLEAGQIILDTRDESGKGMILRTGEYGSVEILLSDGNRTNSWSSDPGMLKAFGKHCVAVIIDGGPGIITFIIDGIVCDGGEYRQYGWGRFDLNLGDINGERIKIGRLKKGHNRPIGRLTKLRLYNRYLYNSELIGNHRSFYLKNQ